MGRMHPKPRLRGHIRELCFVTLAGGTALLTTTHVTFTTALNLAPPSFSCLVLLVRLGFGFGLATCSSVLAAEVLLGLGGCLLVSIMGGVLSCSFRKAVRQ